MIPVKRIEKEFLLKALYEEKLPITYHQQRTDYELNLIQPVKEMMVLSPDKPIGGLKSGFKMQLMFSYHGQVINFTAEIDYVKDGIIFCGAPEALYKNLGRSFLRITAPGEFRCLLTVKGWGSGLEFPEVNNFEEDDIGDFLKGKETGDLPDIIDAMVSRIKQYANGYKMITFKDYKPQATEELILVDTCKALFLPTTQGGFPETDPYDKKRIITQEMFKLYLESTGVRPQVLDAAADYFIKQKYDKGIFSDAWVPILYHNYIVGYIHIWSSKKTNPPLDFKVLDIVFELAKILCHSLKANGYFEKSTVENKSFESKIVDISASGLLFSYPSSSFSVALQVKDELKAKIITPERSIDTVVSIVRRYREGTTNFFGCKFIDMAEEDMQFLSEALYGKDFENDNNSIIFSGQV